MCLVAQSGGIQRGPSQEQISAISDPLQNIDLILFTIKNIIKKLRKCIRFWLGKNIFSMSLFFIKCKEKSEKKKNSVYIYS